MVGEGVESTRRKRSLSTPRPPLNPPLATDILLIISGDEDGEARRMIATMFCDDNGNFDFTSYKNMILEAKDSIEDLYLEALRFNNFLEFEQFYNSQVPPEYLRDFYVYMGGKQSKDEKDKKKKEKEEKKQSQRETKKQEKERKRLSKLAKKNKMGSKTVAEEASLLTRNASKNERKSDDKRSKSDSEESGSRRSGNSSYEGASAMSTSDSQSPKKKTKKGKKGSVH